MTPLPSLTLDTTRIAYDHRFTPADQPALLEALERHRLPGATAVDLAYQGASVHATYRNTQGQPEGTLYFLLRRAPPSCWQVCVRQTWVDA
jgi:hypothetical protein